MPGDLATWLPGLLWIFAVIPAYIQIFREPTASAKSVLLTETAGWKKHAITVDADIGGIGVRIGLYIPLGLALLTLVIGLFHKDDSGAKEIGNAQLLSLFYLNFNAVKASGNLFRGLKFPEIVLACASIDFTAAGLHMTNSGKESLASRWAVGLSTFMQFIATFITMFMLGRIKHNYKGQPCAYIKWWGRIDSCTGPSRSTWLYIGVRTLILLHGVWLDWTHTFVVDGMKKQWDDLAPDNQDTDKDQTRLSAYQYASLRGTVFSKWFEWLPSVVVAIASIESLVHRLPSDNHITDWGQSAALVLAIAGGLHWAFVLSEVMRLQRLAKLAWAFLHHRFQKTPGKVVGIRQDLTILRQGCLQIWAEDKRLARPTNFTRYAKSWQRGNEGSVETLLEGVKLGDLKKVRRAVKCKADINFVGPEEDGMTPLLHAIARDNVGMVKMLIRMEADPAKSQTEPAICFAAREGSEDMLQELLSCQQISPSQPDGQGRTPILIAASRGNEKHLKRLLECLEQHSHDSNGKVNYDLIAQPRDTVLLAAALNGRAATAKVLFQYFSKHGDVRSAASAMVKATLVQVSQAIKLMVEIGISPDQAVDDKMTTLIHLAASTCDVHTLDAFVPIKKRPVEALERLDRHGRTALICATIEKNLPNIQWLLARGADLDKRDRTGTSAIELAVRSGEDSLIDAFFRAFTEAMDRKRLLPFIFAVDEKTQKWLEATGRFFVLNDNIEDPPFRSQIFQKALLEQHVGMFRVLYYSASFWKLDVAQYPRTIFDGWSRPPSDFWEKLDRIASLALERGAYEHHRQRVDEYKKLLETTSSGQMPSDPEVNSLPVMRSFMRVV